MSKNLELSPGRRTTFRNCKLIRLTDYVADFRGAPVRLFRHVWQCPGMSHLLIYTGLKLPIQLYETRDIKGTIKREEFTSIKFLRISKPKVLDKSAPVPLLEIQRKQGE